MDIQLKRGMLDVCVLAVLSNGDSYGYKIIKDINACIDMSESTLYPILKRLESGDFLSVYSVEHNSRLRKYYKLEETGIAKIDEFKKEWQEVLHVYDFIASQGKENVKNDET